MDNHSGTDVVIIGAGNVALQLGKRFKEKDINVLQVYNRTLAKAKLLARSLITDYTDEVELVNRNADLYIICVSDSSIEEIAAQFQSILRDKLIVHTSGAISSQVLAKYYKHYGVFYPLQSFSASSSPQFDKVPICVFSKEKVDLILLLDISKRISNTVEIITDEQRLVLHLAAVLVNNFSNQLYVLADSFLKEHNLTLKLLLPLIEETVNKIHQSPPAEMQTGPAKRGDMVTIQKHRALLKDDPLLLKLYLDLSKSINPDLNL